MSELRKNVVGENSSSLSLDGFEGIYSENQSTGITYQASDDMLNELNQQLTNLSQRLTDLVSLGIDQRMEIAKLGTQIIDNQRQLVAAQQILIRLMDRSIDLTRHISYIEERLPALMELPKIVEALKDRLVQVEGIEIR